MKKFNFVANFNRIIFASFMAFGAYFAFAGNVYPTSYVYLAKNFEGSVSANSLYKCNLDYAYSTLKSCSSLDINKIGVDYNGNANYFYANDVATSNNGYIYILSQSSSSSSWLQYCKLNSDGSLGSCKVGYVFAGSDTIMSSITAVTINGSNYLYAGISTNKNDQGKPVYVYQFQLASDGIMTKVTTGVFNDQQDDDSQAYWAQALTSHVEGSETYLYLYTNTQNGWQVKSVKLGSNGQGGANCSSSNNYCEYDNNGGYENSIHAGSGKSGGIFFSNNSLYVGYYGTEGQSVGIFDSMSHSINKKPTQLTVNLFSSGSVLKSQRMAGYSVSDPNYIYNMAVSTNSAGNPVICDFTYGDGQYPYCDSATGSDGTANNIGSTYGVTIYTVNAKK